MTTLFLKETWECKTIAQLRQLVKALIAIIVYLVAGCAQIVLNAVMQVLHVVQSVVGYVHWYVLNVKIEYQNFISDQQY